MPIPECSVLRRHHEQMMSAPQSAQRADPAPAAQAPAATATPASSSQGAAASTMASASHDDKRPGIPWTAITIAVVGVLLIWVLIRKMGS